MDDQSEFRKYKLIEKFIEDNIENQTLKKGDQAPSINAIAHQHAIARRTVQKAYNELARKGILVSVPAKGYYVASTRIDTEFNVFLLFDNFTSYKQTLFYAIKDEFGEGSVLNLHFHYFNPSVFERSVRDSLGKYTHYIILPGDNVNCNNCLNTLSIDNTYLLSRAPGGENRFAGVFQDFSNDIEKALRSTGNLMWKYKRLHLLFYDFFTIPPGELLSGFKRFCHDLKIDYRIWCEPFNGKLMDGEAYIVIDENDLKTIVLEAKKNRLKLGRDIGVISYNETPLKEVVSESGISVISTDFEMMGRTVVKMIRNKDFESIKNPCRFIDRGSF